MKENNNVNQQDKPTGLGQVDAVVIWNHHKTKGAIRCELKDMLLNPTKKS